MRRTKEDAELTKKAILSAAVEVFSQRGVAKASLEEIARKADVTRGAVYWHFKNKMEIFDALHESLHTPLIERILEGLEAEHPNPIGQLQALCTNLLLELDQDEFRKKTLTLFMLKCDYSGTLQDRRDAHTRAKYEKMQAFSGYFQKAIETGQLPSDADACNYTVAMNCYIRGIVTEYLEAPEAFDMPNKAPALMEIFFSRWQQG